jgi:integrase
MKAKITKRRVENLKPGQIVVDDEIKGFVARRLGSGAITYGFRYRDRGTSRQRWLGLGLHGSITADQARIIAKKRAGEVADARDPVAEREATRAAAAKTKVADKYTVDAIIDAFVARYVKNLRSAYETERAFNVYVRPRIGNKSIYDVKRRDIVEMLDEIEDKNGPVMADRVLAHIRKAFNWQAARDDQFSPPIVRGMARTKPVDRARTRILADDEIRSLWAALASTEAPESFRNIIRVLLLTAQRRSEVGRMHADELDGDLWTIPAERYKTGIPNYVPLTAEARRWLPAQSATKGKGGFIFSTTGGKKAFNGYSKAKGQLDRVIAEQRKKAGLKPIPRWTLHDLRRTARSLLSRAGVQSDVAERVLGHVIPGVRGVYDRHSYAAEKRDALEKLAGLIRMILNPSVDNVVQLKPASA